MAALRDHELVGEAKLLVVCWITTHTDRARVDDVVEPPTILDAARMATGLRGTAALRWVAPWWQRRPSAPTRRLRATSTSTGRGCASGQCDTSPRLNGALSSLLARSIVSFHKFPAVTCCDEPVARVRAHPRECHPRRQ